MKKIILLFCLLFFGTLCSAQDDVMTIAEQMPVFPGGEQALKEYLKTNVHYPEIEKEFRISGIVYVSFIVTKEGKITDIRCLKPIKDGPALNKEAIRAISSMPLWKPGTQKGKPVNVQYALPVKFLLDNSEPLTDEQIVSIANQHYKKGQELMLKKDFKNALHEFDYAIFALPSDVNTLYQRGMACHYLGMDKEACNEWNKIKFQDNHTADKMLDQYCH